jgi:hypothetical protein
MFIKVHQESNGQSCVVNSDFIYLILELKSGCAIYWAESNLEVKESLKEIESQLSNNQGVSDE